MVQLAKDCWITISEPVAPPPVPRRKRIWRRSDLNWLDLYLEDHVLLKHLSHHASVNVRFALLETPSVPMSVIAELMQDRNPYIAARASEIYQGQRRKLA